MVLNPVPAGLAVSPDLFEDLQDSHLSSGLAFVGLTVDDVVQRGAGSGPSLSAAARCLLSVLVVARRLVQDLDQEWDAAGLPHGDAAVLGTGQSQQGPGHLLFVPIGQHREQPEHHLHLRPTGTDTR